MHRKKFNAALLIVVGCLAACGAVRAPLGVATAAQGDKCGAPNSPCGAAIPAGVQCPKGPGWYQAGHYCGWSKEFVVEQRTLKAAPAPDANTSSHSGSSACDGNAEAMKAALKALTELTMNDITQIKRMKNPPLGVRLVLEAICVLMGVKPTRVKDAQSGKMVDSYAAASQKMLDNKNFIRNLMTFDKDHIPPKTLEKIQTYTSMPELQPEKIKKTCLNAYGLCSWVHAMALFGRMAQEAAACPAC